MDFPICNNRPCHIHHTLYLPSPNNLDIRVSSRWHSRLLFLTWPKLDVFHVTDWQWSGCQWSGTSVCTRSTSKQFFFKCMTSHVVCVVPLVRHEGFFFSLKFIFLSTASGSSEASPEFLLQDFFSLPGVENYTCKTSHYLICYSGIARANRQWLE